MVTADATCHVCGDPLVSLPDLPDSHPGCSPIDAERWRLATGGVRTYTGRGRPAVHDAGCVGCDGRIAVGELVSLVEVDGVRAWVHDLCAVSAAEPSRGPLSPVTPLNDRSLPPAEAA